MDSPFTRVDALSYAGLPAAEDHGGAQGQDAVLATMQKVQQLLLLEGFRYIDTFDPQAWPACPVKLSDGRHACLLIPLVEQRFEEGIGLIRRERASDNDLAVIAVGVAAPQAPVIQQLAGELRTHFAYLDACTQTVACTQALTVLRRPRIGLGKTSWLTTRLMLRVFSPSEARRLANVDCIATAQAGWREGGNAYAYLHGLRNLAPRTPVTSVLMGLNILVYVAMVATGVHPVDPAIDDLVNWQASFGPYIIEGESWRMLTSTFVHGGILHLALNMWAFWGAGQLVERMFGSRIYLLLYLLAGLGGSAASLAVNPTVVGVGASGAIFGVYGALLGHLAARRRETPSAIVRNLGKSAIAFTLYNVAFGLSSSEIDNAAHLGGLFTGLLCGLMTSRSITHFRPGGVRRAALAAIMVAVVATGIAGSWRLVGRSPLILWDRSFDAVLQADEDIGEQASAIMSDLESGQLSTDDAPQLIESRVLKPFRERVVATVQTMHDMCPSEQAPVQTALSRYVSAREKAYKALRQSCLGQVQDREVEEIMQALEQATQAFQTELDE